MMGTFVWGCHESQGGWRWNKECPRRIRLGFSLLLLLGFCRIYCCSRRAGRVSELIARTKMTLGCSSFGPFSDPKRIVFCAHEFFAFFFFKCDSFKEKEKSRIKKGQFSDSSLIPSLRIYKDIFTLYSYR